MLVRLRGSNYNRIRRFCSVAAVDPKSLVNLDRYPLHDLQSEAGQKFLHDCRTQLDDTGLLHLPGFLTPKAINAFLREESYCHVNKQASHVKYSHTTEFNTDLKEGEQAKHEEETEQWVVGYSQLGQESYLKALYHWTPVREVVTSALGHEVYLSEDPLNRLHLNRYRPDDKIGWHHDKSEFFFNLVLQQPTVGGQFEYVKGSLGKDELVTQVVEEGSRSEVTLPTFEPGSVAIFRGRENLHRVTTCEGGRSRITCIFNFASTEGGGMLEDEVRDLFFGEGASERTDDQANNSIQDSCTRGVEVAHQAVIDLRSDTVTKPTPGLSAAMASAEVGDDVFGDDPTVLRLQAHVAEMFGKEDALFVPSGTMSNLIAVMAHTWERGSEYIVGDRSHLNIWEQAAPAQFGGASPRTVRNYDDGTFSLDELTDAIRIDDIHFPATKVICIEDTFQGRVLPLQFLDDVGDIARDRGIKLHLDGARVWNAIVASGIDGKRRALHADSLSVCLSKGLGAPAGSLVVGDSTFIARCRRLRKGLGGGMRQVGVLAAAGLHALEFHLPALSTDHAHAQRLADRLTRLPGLHVDLESVETNMVWVQLTSDSKLTAPELEKELAKRGVLCCHDSNSVIRLVTNINVGEEAIDQTAAAFSDAMLCAV